MRRRTFLQSSGAAMGGIVFGAGPGFAANAEQPRRGGTLIWGHSETTQNLDIHGTATASTLRLLQNVHDTIVTVNHKFEVLPNIAERFDISPDLLTYTFHLRRDVKFHDGSPLTAADVKYTFERIKDPKTAAVNYDVFIAAQSFETPDDHTVVVHMSRVFAPFLARLAELGAGAIIPKDSGSIQGTKPIGCGPFKFVSREFGNKAELARFDQYWQGAPYLDGILEYEVTEPTVRLTGLQTGQFHLINDIPLERLAKVKADPALQVKTWFPLCWAFLNFNHAVKPFDDPRVRQALDLMIDKDALMQGALWGGGVVTGSPSFPSSASYDPAIKPRKQDFAAAKALLSQAGIAPGQLQFVFKVTTNYPWHVQAAQIMQAWFEEGGVKATTQQLTWADWLSQCWIHRDFEVTMMNFFTLWEPDFLYFSIWNTKGSFNYRNVHDPQIDAWTEAARRSTDPAERARLYKQVQARVHDQTHDVILWFRDGTVGARPNVGGLDQLVHPNGSNLEFRHVWLTS